MPLLTPETLFQLTQLRHSMQHVRKEWGAQVWAVDEVGAGLLHCSFKNGQTSLHRHFCYDNLIKVDVGCIDVLWREEYHRLEAGQVIVIPARERHQLITVESSVLHEIYIPNQAFPPTEKPSEDIVRYSPSLSVVDV